LFEEAKHGDVMHGFTANYIKVEAPYRKELVNETRRVLLHDFNEDKTALTVTIIE
jgi:threonylcarbamoyladenosine tRNA methylthiotransferase MtaB